MWEGEIWEYLMDRIQTIWDELDFGPDTFRGYQSIVQEQDILLSLLLRFPPPTDMVWCYRCGWVGSDEDQEDAAGSGGLYASIVCPGCGWNVLQDVGDISLATRGKK